MTGTGERGGEGVWTWRRPHPGCVVASLGAGGRTFRRDRHGPTSSSDLRPVRVRVRVAASLGALDPDLLRRALARHRSGDYGSFGRRDDPAPADLDPWCPGVFGVAARNRLALGSGVGLVASRFILPVGKMAGSSAATSCLREGDDCLPDKLDLAILTALGGGRASTVAVPIADVPSEVLQDELPRCDRRFYSGGPPDPGDGVALARRRSGRRPRPVGLAGLAAALVG